MFNNQTAEGEGSSEADRERRPLGSSRRVNLHKKQVLKPINSLLTLREIGLRAREMGWRKKER
jgi:hypothetical protein